MTTINEYNDILALWIKMKQGTLSLNIETFSLNELFDLLGKGRRAFEMKKQKPGNRTDHPDGKGRPRIDLVYD
ncbi:hypothetical protein NXV33_01370 [Bacteroides thetaiotaomicron]|nr:hypothetical protein [Bacteroides thetaiotaomicron]